MMNKEPKAPRGSTHSYGIAILCFFVGLVGIILGFMTITKGNFLSIVIMVFGLVAAAVAIIYMFKVSRWLPLGTEERKAQRKPLDTLRIVMTAIALVAAFASIFVI